MPNLPIPPRDVSLYSLVTHIQVMNRLQNDGTACAALFGGTEAHRVGDAPVDMECFCAATGNVYGSAREVVRTATVLPFFLRLGSRPGLVRSVVHDRPRVTTSHPAEGLGLAALSNGNPYIWRWCLECMLADRREYGVSFWRPSHHLPGVGICTRHGRTLVEVRVPFRQRQQYFFLPDNISSLSGASSLPGAEVAMDHQIRLANLAETILKDTSAPFAPWAIQGTILDGLRERGLVTRRGFVRKTEFAEGMHGHCRSILPLPAFGTSLARRNLFRLAHGLTDVSQVRPAIESLLLVDWLFGSWALFRDRCAWRVVMGSHEPDMNNRNDISGKSAIGLAVVVGGNHNNRRHVNDSRRLHRKSCLAFLEQNPGACRTDFWHEDQKSCHWLIRHDAEWMGALLPLAERKKNPQMSFYE